MPKSGYRKLACELVERVVTKRVPISYERESYDREDRKCDELQSRDSILPGLFEACQKNNGIKAPTPITLNKIAKLGN
jgi:hypothetical protein